MKKSIFLVILSLGFIFNSCTKEVDEKPVVKEVSLKVESDPIFRGKIYPSLFYALAGLKKNDNKIFLATLNSNIDVKVKLEMIENDFTFHKELIVDLKKGNNEVEIDVPWKYSDFRNLTTAGYTDFKFRVVEQETNKLLNTFDLIMEHRSINECVYAVQDLGKNKISPLFYLFVSYVNEDSPLIDKFLSETLNNYRNKYRVDEWKGYQGEYIDVLKQVACIVNELYLRGMKYSNITDTSNSNNGLYSQYVRFIEESLTLTQANCVDGSVLLASILEKIGIDCFLIRVPHHMYMGCFLDKAHENFMLVETTAISTGDLDLILLDVKAKAGDFEHYEEMKNNQNGYSLIGIKECRSIGIKPIQ